MSKRKMFFDFGNYQNLPRVAVIDFKGKIDAESTSGMSFANMKPYIDSAFSQPNLEVVILKINCPGGSPVQCELVSTYIKSKMEASGGYWIACSGSKIYAATANASTNEGLGLVDGIDHLNLELYLERTYGNVILVQLRKKSENFLDQFKKKFSLKVFSDFLQKVSPISCFY